MSESVLPDNTHEALAKVIADALEWDWPAVPEEHIPSALECVADAASAVLAWLVAEGWSKTEPKWEYGARHSLDTARAMLEAAETVRHANECDTPGIHTESP